MRHLVSIVVAPVLGLVVYLLFGIALSRADIGSDDGWSVDNIVSVSAAVGAGLVYAVLSLARLSPLGPILVGLAYLGLTWWAVTDSGSFKDTVPGDALGSGSALQAPAVPLAAALAMPLLATALSARRWRRQPYPRDVYAAPTGPASGPPPGYGGPPPGYGMPPEQPPVPVPAFYDPPGYPSEESPTLPLPGHDPGPPRYSPPPSLNPDVTQRF